MNAREIRLAALYDIHTERLRQITAEGWTEAHDDEHDAGTLVTAAACYTLNAACVLNPYNGTPIEDIRDSDVPWPFGVEWWKPGTPRRDLIKAAALILAELERMARKP